MPFDRRQNCAGFTIIEVLVALAIVTAVLAAIGSVIATTARGTRSLEAHLALIETARAIATGMPKRAQLVGDLSGEISGHRWRIDVLPFAAGGIVPAADARWIPQTVVISVRSPSGALLQLNTVRLHRRANG
jgi:general secretion pathway protein I